MKNAIDEMIDEAKKDSAQMLDSARQYETDALRAEEDGNGDPSYLRACAKDLRDSADDLIDKARSAAASALGSIRTAKKAASSRENGKKGGRPINFIYRVEVDYLDHSESAKFSSKTAAAEYARYFDWATTIYKLDESRDDWYIIGTKLRYAKKITWQEGFLGRPQD